MGSVASAVRADLIIPGSLAAAEGNASGATSLLLGSGNSTELYQIAASELAAQGLTPGDSISGVRARLNGGVATGPGGSMFWSDMTITLAQATNSIAAMSTNFAANMSNPVTVLNGNYTLAPASMPGGAAANPFGALVAFNTPYIYQGGDLVFYFTHTTATGGSLVQDAAFAGYTGAGTLYRSLRNTSTYQAATGTLGDGVSNPIAVLKLEVNDPGPVAVPEAGAWLFGLIAAATTGVSSWARRRRR